MNYFLRFFFLILGVLLFFSCNNDESDPVLFEVDFKVTNITCNTKGAINLTINGGTPPYSFLWSTNQTTKDIKDIEKEGTYNVTVVDNMGLTKILNIDIKRINSKIDVKAEIAESSVFTDNGSINLIVTGGIPPYKIIWSNSETTNKISNLGPGVYQVRISDVNECQYEKKFLITAKESFTDSRDGKKYTMIKNGDQIWMYEPLNFETATGSSFLYDDSSYSNKGRLYTWETIMNGERLDPIHAIDIQGLCPEGWHIPSVMEWKKFEEFLQTQEDQYGRIEWTRFLGEYSGVAFYLFDFHDGVQWISDGFTTYSTNVSDTFVRLESDKLGYKSTMVYPDENYWTEYRHFCHCIKNNN